MRQLLIKYSIHNLMFPIQGIINVNPKLELVTHFIQLPKSKNNIFIIGRLPHALCSLLLKELPHFTEHLVLRAGGVNLPHEVQLPEVVNDGHRRVDVGVEALLERLLVVVGAARPGGAPAQAALDARLLVAVEEEDEALLDLVAHGGVPALQVVLVAGEAVDEEVVLLRLVHGGLEERARDLDGDDGAVADVALDQLAVLRARLAALCPQEVPW